MTIEKDVCYRARRDDQSLLATITIRKDGTTSLIAMGDCKVDDLPDLRDFIEYVMSIHKTEPTLPGMPSP